MTELTRPVRTKGLSRYITETKKLRAITMWENGKDTAFIAERLNVPEWYIYNKLPIWAGREHDEAERRAA